VAGDQAVGFEQFVCGGDGGPVQAKLTSQFAGWRELSTGLQATGIDHNPQLVKYLTVEREFGAWIETG
jgi:hypothetical protein